MIFSSRCSGNGLLRGGRATIQRKRLRGKIMRARIATTLAVYMVSAAVAGEPGGLVDKKTNRLTKRGITASIIAAAQVSEMQCGLKGQIAGALRKADQEGMHFDLKDKADYADVGSFATSIMNNTKKDDFAKWCQNYREMTAPLFNPQ